MEKPLADTPACSIERSLTVLGARWTIMILRELVAGRTKFADIRDALGIPPAVLSARLKTLTEAGLLERVPYQEFGQRHREGYHLTEAGERLKVVLAALQQWGDEFRPRPSGPSSLRRSADSGHPVRVALLDAANVEVPVESLEFVPN